MDIKTYKDLVKPSEHQVQTEIINWLRGQGYYVQRLNSGKYAVGEGVSRRMVHGVKAGTPDLMVFRAKEVPIRSNFIPENVDIVVEKLAIRVMDLLFVEVKRPGNKPTRLQEAVMEELEEYGARCIVAHSLEELKEQL